MRTDPRISVIVASCGRPEVIADLSRALARQTLTPTRVVFSVAHPRDLPARYDVYAGATIIVGARGLAAQRNRALCAVLDESDIIIFFDDDYVPSRFALAGIALFFAENPGHVGVNGRLLADGINSKGISPSEAAKLVDAYDAALGAPDPRPILDLRGLYGCNMAFRASAIGTARFDEKLPLYGWQEDIDFAAQLLPRGRLATTEAFAGVHRGIKSGRSCEVRLGYSQIANPIYLARKGTMRRSHSMRLILGNILANHWRALRQEPWIDRRGRVRGNWLALVDSLFGRIDPERILKL